jgi:hypothetical protein
MDNVQKHNICFNVPSSQTFRLGNTSLLLIGFLVLSIVYYCRTLDVKNLKTS